jgi:O-acetyl-ADP-ribose deacetylase (regulator of RNase III)/transcriptional regulator with XRE-family HTH domain
MPFQIVRNDITKVRADAIVNTANPHVAVGAGVDLAIYRAAGYKQLLVARSRIGELRAGEVGVTEAFALHAKYIIHVSGPVWKGGSRGEAEILRSCYDQALHRAYERGCRSIAFPLLATGAYGFPKELGLQIAIDAFTAFLEKYEIEITLVVFGASAVRVTGKLADEIESYIDDDYVRKAYRKAYREGYSIGGRPEVKRNRTRDSARTLPDEWGAGSALYEEEMEEDQDESISISPKSRPKQTKTSLDDILKKIYKESFGKHLRKLIIKKGLKNSNVYAAANISKQYFSKLLKDQVKPSKEKVLALAVGLRLNLDETVDFLKVAGYALSPISQTDKVVEYFIEKKDYNVLKIDIVLFDYGLSPLSKS